LSAILGHDSNDVREAGKWDGEGMDFRARKDKGSQRKT
jgi:hypothetical protein